MLEHFRGKSRGETRQLKPYLAIRGPDAVGRMPVRIEEVGAQIKSQIHGKETRGKLAPFDFDVSCRIEIRMFCGFALSQMAVSINFHPAYRCEAVVGRNENVCVGFRCR